MRRLVIRYAVAVQTCLPTLASRRLARACKIHGPGAIWGVVCAMAVTASEAQAGALPEPYAMVINTPALLPPEGLLAVGTFDAATGRLQTEGVLGSVQNSTGAVITGTATTLVVTLEDGSGTLSQEISLWRPDAPMELGSSVAISRSASDTEYESVFQVVEASEENGIEVEFVDAVLHSFEEVASELPCGETVGPRGDLVPVALVTHQRSKPALRVTISVNGANPVVSQHFFRRHRPGLASFEEYGPLGFDEAESAIAFETPAEEYCLEVQVLPLETGEPWVTEPVCVADDGRDWIALLPVPSEQFDDNLLLCSDPPDEYRERWCALWLERGERQPGCEEFLEEPMPPVDEMPMTPLPPAPVPTVPAQAEPPSPAPVAPTTTSPDSDGSPTEPSVSEPSPTGQDTNEPPGGDAGAGERTEIDRGAARNPVDPEGSEDQGSEGCSCTVAGKARGSSWLWVLTGIGVASSGRRRKRQLPGFSSGRRAHS